MFMRPFFIIFLLCAIYAGFVESYKILVVSPLPSRSHHNLGKGIADILHDAEHEVTLITIFPSEKPVYREVPIETENMPQGPQAMTFQEMASQSNLKGLKVFLKFINNLLEGVFTSKKVEELLNSEEEKFDLIIVEYFLNHALTGLGVKYDCPVIMLSPVSIMYWLARLTGNPVSPATVPNGFMDLPLEMNLRQRTVNTLLAAAQEITGHFYMDGFQADAYEKYLPKEAAEVPYSELHEKIALTFSNTHSSMGGVRPLLPNVVEIGGYFISDNTTIPEEYMTILDNAKNGVIFFSMGSNLKSSEMPEQLKTDILAALGKRKETVLWKYEEDLPQKPKNIIIRSWMPQASILTHPNVKLFITHGGLLSTTEASASGVPVLSIPVFGDQYRNAKATEERGCGITLQLTDITEDSLTSALNEVLDNTKYKTESKKISALFHDRPVNAKELVAFYAKHVIETGGAKHLSSTNLPLYSSLLLDVLAVIMLPPIIMICLTIWLCKKWCGTSARKQRKSKKE